MHNHFFKYFPSLGAFYNDMIKNERLIAELLKRELGLFTNASFLYL